MNSKREQRYIRHLRVRSTIRGNVERPRLSVFRSNKHVWVQLVDDTTGKTIVSASDIETVGKIKETLAVRAEKVGELIAKRALKHKIQKSVFDRGGYKYHGIVKAVADGMRKGGLVF